MSEASRMLLLSSLLAVVALAELFTFTALRLKYGNDCSGNYQPRAMTVLVLDRSKVVNEFALSMEVRELLYAFELAAPHVKKGGTYASRLTEQQELALGLIDWAICECDRGVDLLKVLTKPDEIAR